MVCLYLKLKKHFLAIFGYSFWKCVAKLATVSKILARAQVRHDCIVYADQYAVDPQKVTNYI